VAKECKEEFFKPCNPIFFRPIISPQPLFYYISVGQRVWTDSNMRA